MHQHRVDDQGTADCGQEHGTRHNHNCPCDRDGRCLVISWLLELLAPGLGSSVGAASSSTADPLADPDPLCSMRPFRPHCHDRQLCDVAHAPRTQPQAKGGPKTPPPPPPPLVSGKELSSNEGGWDSASGLKMAAAAPSPWRWLRGRGPSNPPGGRPSCVRSASPLDVNAKCKNL